MSENWTKGEWEKDVYFFDDDRVKYDPPKYAGLVIDERGNSICMCLQEEDANLITAAPDLYAALKAIIDDLPISRDWLDPVNERWAKDALKKARGES